MGRSASTISCEITSATTLSDKAGRWVPSDADEQAAAGVSFYAVAVPSLLNDACVSSRSLTKDFCPCHEECELPRSVLMGTYLCALKKPVCLVLVINDAGHRYLNRVDILVGGRITTSRAAATQYSDVSCIIRIFFDVYDAQVVVFDTSVPVQLAFYALVEHGKTSTVSEPHEHRHRVASLFSTVRMITIVESAVLTFEGGGGSSVRGQQMGARILAQRVSWLCPYCDRVRGWPNVCASYCAVSQLWTAVIALSHSSDVQAAPLWDAAKRGYVGLMTVTDFIDILRHYRYSLLWGCVGAQAYHCSRHCVFHRSNGSTCKHIDPLMVVHLMVSATTLG